MRVCACARDGLYGVFTVCCRRTTAKRRVVTGGGSLMTTVRRVFTLFRSCGPRTIAIRRVFTVFRSCGPRTTAVRRLYSLQKLRPTNNSYTANLTIFTSCGPRTIAIRRVLQSLQAAAHERQLYGESYSLYKLRPTSQTCVAPRNAADTSLRRMTAGWASECHPFKQRISHQLGVHLHAQHKYYNAFFWTQNPKQHQNPKQQY